MNSLPRRAAWPCWPARHLQPATPRPLATQPAQGQNGPARGAPALGQHWTYGVFNVYNGEQVDTVREEISNLAPITLRHVSTRKGELPPEIHAVWDQVQQDPVWDAVQTYDTPLPLWAEPLVVGALQAIDTGYRAGTSSFRLWISLQSRAAGLESVSVAAGEFDTVRIERYFRLTHSDSSCQSFTRTDTLWFAPAIGRWVARETNGEYWTSGRRPNQYREDHWRWELESWA